MHVEEYIEMDGKPRFWEDDTMNGKVWYLLK